MTSYHLLGLTFELAMKGPSAVGSVPTGERLLRCYVLIIVYADYGVCLS